MLYMFVVQKTNSPTVLVACFSNTSHGVFSSVHAVQKNISIFVFEANPTSGIARLLASVIV